ncbi:MAG: thiol-disulfide oxidoreductase DCC family protein [Iamia sp.]
MPQPDPPYFVWDGQCGFCGRWAGWLERAARPGVPLVAFQDLDDLAAAGLTADDVTRASWWVPADGAPLPGADGIAAALRAGRPRWSRVAGRALGATVVRPLARLAYRQVAANRHRLPAPDVDPPSRPD